MKRFFFLILFCFSVTAGFPQVFYNREANEKASDFVERAFPFYHDKLIHPVIEERWGDSIGDGSKIVIFYESEEEGEPIKRSVILQPVSRNKYKVLPVDFEFGIGVYINSSGIASVYFHDFNHDGMREMVVVQHGSYRCEVELEDYNAETGQTDTTYTTATCDLCGYAVFIQQSEMEAPVLMTSDEIVGIECTASAIKEILQPKKEEKQD